MSLANARKHWKSLAAIALVFIVLALAGPLVFYGLPVLFTAMTTQDSVLLLLAFPVLIVGWFFGSLWLGSKANELPVSGDGAGSTDEALDG